MRADAEAWHKRAFSFETSLNFERAINAAAMSVVLAPTEPALWFHLGWLQLKDGRATECYMAMLQTLEVEAAACTSYYSDVARFVAAEALHRLGRYPEALELCAQVRDDFALYISQPLSKAELVQACRDAQMFGQGGPKGPGEPRAPAKEKRPR